MKEALVHQGLLRNGGGGRNLVTYCRLAWPSGHLSSGIIIRVMKKCTARSLCWLAKPSFILFGTCRKSNVCPRSAITWRQNIVPVTLEGRHGVVWQRVIEVHWISFVCLKTRITYSCPVLVISKTVALCGEGILLKAAPPPPLEVLEIFWNQDSVVDLVTRLEPERRRIGARLLAWTRNFLLCVQTGSAVTQPPVLWVPVASLLVKWLGVKVITHQHVMPRLRMLGVYLYTPLNSFMAWCVITHGYNFT